MVLGGYVVLRGQVGAVRVMVKVVETLVRGVTGDDTGRGGRGGGG